MRFKGSKFGLLLLAVLLVLGILPRIAGCKTEMLSAAEAFSWRMARYRVPALFDHLLGDAHPPLYYLVLKLWTGWAGSSPFSMRVLSVFFSSAALAVLYLLCREFVQGPAALFAVCLAALSTGQITAAQVARMYGLGIFLAALTGWLLIRARSARSCHLAWWSAYGLAVAAFCLTHYFAFFTVLAQSVFVLADLLARNRAETRQAPVSSCGGFIYANSLAALLFAFWLPVFLSQASDVRQGWWVPALSAGELARLFCPWLTGMPYQGAAVSRIWLGMLVVLAGWTVTRGGSVAWFFLVQALFPWLAALCVSAMGGQTILQERYFAFCQLSLFAFWSVTWKLLPGILERLLLMVVLCLPAAAALAEHFNSLPDQPPAMQRASEWLGTQNVDNDLFVVDDYRAVNQFRCYACQAGLPWLNVKCHFLRPAQGHIVHVAALEVDDVYWSEDELWAQAAPRVWRLSVVPEWPLTPVPGRQVLIERTFDSGGTNLTLVCHAKGTASHARQGSP